ncbi:hypothetical protein [Parapedobacter sp. DT-150]|uniref:hypothetical protein n=1 Tax=Parapedobacter sp. DT-150 TaxID=3396162 RepID=UPI003F53F39B
MDRKPRKELIAGIKDFLRDIEEPYDHREWEHFQRHRNAKRRKPVPLFVKLAGIAASLFLMVYASVRFLPFFERVGQNEQAIPVQHPPSSDSRDSTTKDTAVIEPAPSALDVEHDDQKDEDISVKRLSPALPTEAASEREALDSVIPTTTRAVPLTPDSLRISHVTKKTEIQAVPLSKAWSLHRSSLHGKPNKSLHISLPNLWPPAGSRGDLSGISVGFNLNPALSNKGFSLGGGVSARIPLSDRISTEIGLTYTTMKVGRDRAADITDTVSTQLVGMRNTVGMVMLPVSLNYAISEHFTASLGVAPFTVVRDRRTDILESYHWIRGDVASGDTSLRLVSERSELKRPDSLYQNNTYLGFIQLSGYVHPPFLRRYNAVIAPYIGVPIGRLRNDQYRWLHGGVSFRIYLR